MADIIYVESLDPSGAYPVGGVYRNYPDVNTAFVQHAIITDARSDIPASVLSLAGSNPIAVAATNLSGTAVDVFSAHVTQAGSWRVDAAQAGTWTVTGSVGATQLGAPWTTVASVVGQPTVTASIAGTPSIVGSVVATQGGAPWSTVTSVIGQPTVTASIAGTPSVVGSVQATTVGSVAATQAGAWTFTGSVGASQLGAPWTTVTSVIGQPTVTASIAGVPAVVASVIGQATVTASVPGTVTAIGSVAATQAGAWTVTANQGGAPWSQVGSVHITQADTTQPITVIVTSTAGGGSTITGSVQASQVGSWGVLLYGLGTGLGAGVSSFGGDGHLLRVDVVRTSGSGGGDGAITDGSDATIKATVTSHTNASALHVIVDSTVGGGSTITGSVHVSNHLTVTASVIGQPTMTASIAGVPTIVGSIAATQAGAWTFTGSVGATQLGAPWTVVGSQSVTPTGSWTVGVIAGSGTTQGVLTATSDAGGPLLRVHVVGSDAGTSPTSVFAIQQGSWTVTANQGPDPWTTIGSVGASQLGGPWTTIASVAGTLVVSVAGQPTVTASISGTPTVVGSVAATQAGSYVVTVGQTLAVHDHNNSSSGTLGNGGTFTGTATDVLGFNTVTVQVFADQAGAANGFYLEWSTDGTNWDDNTPQFDIEASTARRFQYPVCARYMRVQYTNGTTPQGAFRLQTLLHPGNLLTSVHRADANVGGDRSVKLVKSILAAQRTGGGSEFTNINATNAGNLKVAIEEYETSLPAGTNHIGTVTASVVGAPTMVASVIGTPTVVGSVVATQGGAPWTTVASVIGTPTIIGSTAATQAGAWTFTGSVGATQLGAPWTVTGSVLASQGNAPWTTVASIIGQPTVTASVAGVPTVVGSVVATQGGSPWSVVGSQAVTPTGSWTVGIVAGSGTTQGLLTVTSDAEGPLLRVHVVGSASGGTSPTSVFAIQQGSWFVSAIGSVAATQAGAPWTTVASVIGIPKVLVVDANGDSAVDASVDAVRTSVVAVGGQSVNATGGDSDAKSAVMVGQVTADLLFGYNGITWDRLRSTIANGLAVDVTRIQGQPTVTASIAGTPTVVGSIAATQAGAWTMTGSMGATQLGAPWTVVASVIGQPTVVGSVRVTQADTTTPFTVIVTSTAGGGSTITGSVAATQAGSWRIDAAQIVYTTAVCSRIVVGPTAVQVPTVAGQKRLQLRNVSGTDPVFLGHSSNVTSATGFAIYGLEAWGDEYIGTIPVWLVTAATSADVRYRWSAS